MAKHGGCSCGGNSVGALDTGSVLTETGVVASAYGGFWAGEYLTENVQTLKDNKLMSGLAKLGVSIGLPLLFPSMVENKMVAGALVGFGVSGGKDTIEVLAAPKTAGLDGWDSYDRNTQDTTYTEVKVEV